MSQLKPKAWRSIGEITLIATAAGVTKLCKLNCNITSYNSLKGKDRWGKLFPFCTPTFPIFFTSSLHTHTQTHTHKLSLSLFSYIQAHAHTHTRIHAYTYKGCNTVQSVFFSSVLKSQSSPICSHPLSKSGLLNFFPSRFLYL